MNKKTLIVMGNAPSLKFTNFELIKKLNIDSFGLNNAFRAYDRINFWPKYFGSFDMRVIDSNKKIYQNMISDANCKIDRFFFCGRKKFKDPTGKRYQHINYRYGRDKAPKYQVDTTKFSKGFKKFYIFGSSGPTAVHCGIAMGYKKIILLGVKGKYVDFVKGSAKDKTSRSGLVIKNTPEKNPNYWFDDYQRKGDKYNIPNAQKFHIPEWKRLASMAKKQGIEVVNCTPGTFVNCFRKSSLEHELLKK